MGRTSLLPLLLASRTWPPCPPRLVCPLLPQSHTPSSLASPTFWLLLSRPSTLSRRLSRSRISLPTQRPSLRLPLLLAPPKLLVALVACSTMTIRSCELGVSIYGRDLTTS